MTEHATSMPDPGTAPSRFFALKNNHVEFKVVALSNLGDGLSNPYLFDLTLTDAESPNSETPQPG